MVISDSIKCSRVMMTLLRKDKNLVQLLTLEIMGQQDDGFSIMLKISTYCCPSYMLFQHIYVYNKE